MRRFTILFLLIIPMILMGQQEKIYQLKESQLTEQQRAQLKANEVGVQVSQTSGVAREIADAFKEIVHTLNVEVNTFADTKAGQFAMILIGWNVMGEDMLGIIVGVPFLFLGSLFFVFVFYKNCITRRVVVSKTGSRFKGTYDVKYDYVNTYRKPTSYGEIGDLAGTRIIHLVAYFVFVIACSFMIF